MAVEEQEVFALPPGYHFRPTDYELLIHYLHPKLTGAKTSQKVIPTVDIYKHEPWDLPRLSNLDGEVLYFLCPRETKSSTGSRTNRSTLKGHWKSTGKDRKVSENELKKLNLEAKKKTLVYYLGRAPRGTRTDWVMHEYRLEGKNLKCKDDYVLCRVLNKKIEEDAAPNGNDECADTIKNPPNIFPGFDSIFNSNVPNTNSATPHHGLSHLSHSNPQCTSEPNDNLDFEISSYTENTDSPNASASATIFQKPNLGFPTMDGIFPSSSTNSFCSLSPSVAKDSPHSEINEPPFNMLLSKLDGEVENPMEDISNLLNPGIDASQFHPYPSENTQSNCNFGHIHIKPPDPYQTWPMGLGEISLPDSEDFWDATASLNPSQYQLDGIDIDDFIIDDLKNNFVDPSTLLGDDTMLQCPDSTTSPRWNQFLNESSMDVGRTSNEEKEASLSRISSEIQDGAPQYLTKLEGTNGCLVSRDALLDQSSFLNQESSSSRIQRESYLYQESQASMKSSYFSNANATLDKCLKEDNQTKVKEDFVNMVKKKMENGNGNGICKTGKVELYSATPTKIKIRPSLNGNTCESRLPRSRMVVPKAMTVDAGESACGSLPCESGVEDGTPNDEDTSNSCARSRLFVRKPFHQSLNKGSGFPSSKSVESDALNASDSPSNNNHSSIPSERRPRASSRWVPSVTVDKASPPDKRSTAGAKPKSYLDLDFLSSSDSFMRSLFYIPSSPAHAKTLKSDETQWQDDHVIPNDARHIVSRNHSLYNDTDSGSTQEQESTSEGLDSDESRGLQSRDNDPSSRDPTPEPQSSFPSSSGIPRKAHRRGNQTMRFLDRVLLVFIVLCFIAAVLPIVAVRFFKALVKHSAFRKAFYLGAFMTLAYFLFHYS